MKRLYIAAVVGVAALFGLAYWKNTFSYGFKTRKWRLGKSVVDCSLVVLAALYLPALLVGWTVMWLTSIIRRPGIRVTLSILAGIVFASIGGVALEVLCVLGILAVDLLTGHNGVYGWWKQQIPEDFLSFLRDEHGPQSTGVQP